MKDVKAKDAKKQRQNKEKKTITIAARIRSLIPKAGFNEDMDFNNAVTDLIIEEYNDSFVGFDKGAFSKYLNGKLSIPSKYFTYFVKTLISALDKKNPKYYDLLMLEDYLYGKELTADSYEEFVIIMNNSPDICLKRYTELFMQANMFVSYDDGICTITDDNGNVTTDYDQPEYSVRYGKDSKRFSPEGMETYYQSILDYMHNTLKEESLFSDDSFDFESSTLEEFERYAKLHPARFSDEEIKNIKNSYTRNIYPLPLKEVRDKVNKDQESKEGDTT